MNCLDMDWLKARRVIDAAIKAAYLKPRSPDFLGAITEMLPG